jgi:glyoxylase-like metal-dependent hydrolase (beta-lactamase superfamily II)
MKISSFTGGMAQTNGYLLESTHGNLLIDAPEGIAAWLDSKGVRIDEILLTHQHYDHVQDAAALQQRGAKIHAHSPYSPDLTLESAARAWGMPIEVEPYQIDSLIDPGSPLEIDGMQITTAHVPGHSTDSVTFYFAENSILFSGDTLFAGSIGRTDLPHGSTSKLLDGIRAHLFTLPPETIVLSGHGPQTTIGDEIADNPFLS